MPPLGPFSFILSHLCFLAILFSMHLQKRKPSERRFGLSREARLNGQNPHTLCTNEDRVRKLKTTTFRHVLLFCFNFSQIYATIRRCCEKGNKLKRVSHSSPFLVLTSTWARQVRQVGRFHAGTPIQLFEETTRIETFSTPSRKQIT